MAAVERDWLILFPEAEAEEDSGALVARLRDAFRGNDPADWAHAAETLREVDEEVRRIIDAGDMRALPGASLALGFMISLRDARTGARAIRQRAGAQRPNKGRVYRAAVIADVMELNDGRLPPAGHLKYGTIPKVARTHDCSPSTVEHIIKSARKENSVRDT